MSESIKLCKAIIEKANLREKSCPLCGNDMKEYITRYRCRICKHEIKKEGKNE